MKSTLKRELKDLKSLRRKQCVQRIIREVQGESIIQRSNEPRKGYDPDPIDMSEYDGMTEDETWEAMFEKAYQKCGGR